VAAALLGAPSALAAPGGSESVRSEHDRVAAEVARIEARVQEAADSLERMTVEAEAAGAVAMRAQAELDTAHAAAEQTSAELAAAAGEVDRTQDDVATIGREAYMGSDDTYGDVAILLDSDSPTELLQQAATLEVLGDERTEQLEELEAAERRQAHADEQARSAVEERDWGTSTGALRGYYGQALEER